MLVFWQTERMSLVRSVYSHLLSWKRNPRRKVLLLRGARQVGKTYIARQLGREFRSFVEVNLSEQPQLIKLFTGGSLDPEPILESLAAFYGTQIVDGETLLFFDEIQESPAAIAALRFFQEKRPNLHVLATGSLLEFALEEVTSFGVGRIEYLYMYPLTFREFLVNLREELLLEQIGKASPLHPLSEPLHTKCLSLLKTYLLLGGMPEVIARYVESRDMVEVARIVSSIVTGYEDDFAKYKRRLKLDQLRETFRSAALQVGKKFVYSHAYRDASSKVVHQALNLITKAGIVHKVFHSSANGIPLGGEVDITKFKTIPLDIGIFNRLRGVHLSDLAVIEPLELITKGELAEAYCGMELLWSKEPYSQEALYYWHRESKSSNAEVDYLIELHGEIYPIEVKASGKGAMHSMRMFLREKGRKRGIRVSTENFARYDDTLVCPLYAVAELGRVVGETAS